ncbi:OmpH family outer membrane protein [Altererythrobacter soli]|uniref:OmpH family outer membrane protein n=1 Tax=Croceibacterium soli TaxID=1739690 RepID=A0A6I4UQU7_9SPHN|nr:OmpH family outer membrane protein [Croceibacterium soli]MXP41252.1 OmpH family outer membrane protein [Croceibacterium soli]
MKIILKPAFAAGIAFASLTAPVVMAPASAQTVKGIAVVNVPAVVANSNAFRTAQTQRPTTYKAQIDQANTRRQAIAAQLQPLYTQFQTAQQAQNPNQQTLQQTASQIQQIEAAGQRELQQILAPVQLSQAYVEEQINDQLVTAIQNAARKQNVTMVISPDSVLYADNSYNMNQAVLDELNTLIPSAQLVPPAGWLPREMREQQQAQQQAEGQAQPAQQPAAAPVQGR